MSKISIKGADTGTGVFTLESPATNTDRTLVLPDEAGTVLVNGTTSNVGINTSSPLAKLHVKGATNGNLLVRGGASAASGLTGTALSSINDAASATVSLTFEGSDFNFVENNAVVAKLDSSGNLLVGTTSTVGNSRAVFQNFTANQWGSFSRGNNYAKATMLEASSGYVDFFYYNGTTSSYAGYIYVSGGVTTYATSSDARLKENIVDAPSALESVNNIQVRSFDWKNGVGSVKYGVIAQEIYEVAPEGVSVGKDTEDGDMEIAWGFDGSKLVPRLIKAIQEQQAIIEKQKTALAASVARIETLEADVATLKGNA